MAFTHAQSPGVNIASAATNQSLTVTKPAAGQLLVAGISLVSSSAVPTPSITDNGAAGWTLFTSPHNYINDSVWAWWYKVSNATDNSSLTSVTFSWTNGASQTGGAAFMDEYDGFVGTPTLDLNLVSAEVFANTQTITGGVPKVATELALGALWTNGAAGSITGTNDYSPNNGTTTYTWTSTQFGGSLVTLTRGWQTPTATPATASVFTITVGGGLGGGRALQTSGATFYDQTVLPNNPGLLPILMSR